MSYRPQVKQPNGQMVDIPLDAETVKGNDVSAKINNIISGAQVVGNATNDGQGNNIAATYATKAELAEAGQFDPSGTYPNLTAGDATHAASADAATKASQDASGNDIVATYATKAENAAKLDAPTVEQFSIPTTSWTALSGADPFTVSATVTATTTIGADATIELYNDQPVAFSQYCFSVASVSGQTLTIYALETPTSAVTLTIGITN